MVFGPCGGGHMKDALPHPGLIQLLPQCIVLGTFPGQDNVCFRHTKWPLVWSKGHSKSPTKIIFH